MTKKTFKQKREDKETLNSNIITALHHLCEMALENKADSILFISTLDFTKMRGREMSIMLKVLKGENNDQNNQ